jgi:hypothetical protein
MSWMNYTGDNRAARGMEFSSQPFDISHQETVAISPLFGTPTFAKSTIETRFLMFYTKVRPPSPESFREAHGPGGFPRALSLGGICTASAL